MPERPPHTDNKLIDEALADSIGGGHGSTSGGRLQREIGSRAELEEATGQDPEPTRVHKHDKRKEPPQSKTNRQ